MLRKTYAYVRRQAERPHAPHALFWFSFAESSFFPIPPDVMLAPMVLARPDRAYWYAFLCTIGSVAGGLLGYAIGYFLAPLGEGILSFMGQSGGLEQFQRWYDQWGAAVILVKGLTPVPYKLVTIASGLAKFSLPIFIATSLITRGGRFFLTAFLLKRFGPQVEDALEKRIGLVTAGALAVVVGGLFLGKLF